MMDILSIGIIMLSLYMKLLDMPFYENSILYLLFCNRMQNVHWEIMFESSAHFEAFKHFEPVNIHPTFRNFHRLLENFKQFESLNENIMIRFWGVWHWNVQISLR